MRRFAGERPEKQRRRQPLAQSSASCPKRREFVVTPQGSPHNTVVTRSDCSRPTPPEPRTNQRAAESSIPATRERSVAASPRCYRSPGRLGALPSRFPKARTKMGLSANRSSGSTRSDRSGSCIRPLSRAPSLQYVHSIKGVPACQYPWRAFFRAIFAPGSSRLHRPEALGRDTAPGLGRVRPHQRLDLLLRASTIDVGEDRGEL